MTSPVPALAATTLAAGPAPGNLRADDVLHP